MQDKSIGLKYNPAEISVLVGAYGPAAQSEPGVKQINVTDIQVHPDWEAFSQTRLDSDLAILVLNDSVTLTDDIQIVCLPSDDDVTVNVPGYVVDWDADEDKPKHFVINSFNNSYCYIVNHFESFFLSPRTFCGGGSEDGDVAAIKTVSGGGFFVRSGSAWVQHGIAVSVKNATDYLTDQTLVFLINVKSFKNWIAHTLRQTDGVVGEAVKGKINLDCEFIWLYYS